ncbi:MAG TPA: hypothetical protein VNF07_11725 [Acidimicrobiales bacterium]|nr:hypothetical protein [Acidimicrobiales bacterium]
MRRSLATSLALGLAGALSLSALPAGASAPTATSVLGAAKKAIAGESGVHIVVAAVSGKTSNKVVADLGAKTGMESVTSGKAQATVKVTDKAAYIGGNSTGLTSLIGLTAAQVKKVGKLWISVKSGTSEYTQLKTETTIAAVASILPNATGTALTTGQAGTSPLYILKWTVAATSTAPKLSDTVKLQAKGATLPVEEDETDSAGSGSTKFTKWGEHVSISPPATASTIDISKVTG